MSQDLVVLGHTIPARESNAVIYWLLSQPEAQRPFVLILQNGSGNATTIGQELVHQVSATMPAVESALERIRRRIDLKRKAERNRRPVPHMERPEAEEDAFLPGQPASPFSFPGAPAPVAAPPPGQEEDLESLPVPAGWSAPAPVPVPATPPPPVSEPPSLEGGGVFVADESEQEATADASVAVATLVAPPPGTGPAAPPSPEGVGATWETILQEVHGAVLVIDASQTVRFRNRSCRLLPEEGPLDTLEEWLDRVALAGQPVQAWLQDLWRDQIPRIIRCQGVEDRSARHLEFRAHLLPDGGLVVTILDVSEADEAEQARRRIQGRFSAIYGGSLLGIALVTGDGAILTSNGAFQELTGLSLAGVEPPLLEACLTHETLRTLGWPEEIKPGLRAQTLLRHRQGRTFPARVWLAPLEEPEGIEDQASAVLFVEDLRAEFRLREELEASQWQNGALIQTLPDLLLLVKNDGTLRDHVVPEGHPLAPASAPGAETSLDAIFPELAPHIMEALAACRQTGAVARREFEKPANEGGIERFELRLAGAGLEDCVALVRHLGPKLPEPEPPTTAEEPVPEEPAQEPLPPTPEPVSESPFTPPWERALFSSLPDGLLVADLRGRILQVNAALSAAIGFSEAEIAGKRLAHLYGGDEPQAFNRAVSEGLSRFRRWDGRVVSLTTRGEGLPTWLSFVPLEPETGPKLILGVHRALPPEPEPEREPEPEQPPQEAAPEPPSEEPSATPPGSFLEPLERMALERQQHRHRNQLQTLGAILHLETDGGDGREYPPTLARALRKQSWRLFSFARLQEIQADDEGRVPLAPFIQSLVNEIIRPTPEAALRVEVSSRFADAVLEDLGAAAFGLLVVEMLSRIREALDHRRDGRGRVEIALTKRAGEVCFELSGPPLPEASILPELGRSLIARSLVKQVGGTLEEAGPASGVLAYRIRFPMEPGRPHPQ